MQRWTKPDLYVEVSTGGSYSRTTEKESQDNPVFDEKLLLWPNQPLEGVLAPGPPAVTVRVMDVDNTGDEEAGVGTLPLPASWESMAPLDTEVRPAAALMHDHFYYAAGGGQVTRLSVFAGSMVKGGTADEGYGQSFSRVSIGLVSLMHASHAFPCLACGWLAGSRSGGRREMQCCRWKSSKTAIERAPSPSRLPPPSSLVRCACCADSCRVHACHTLFACQGRRKCGRRRLTP